MVLAPSISCGELGAGPKTQITVSLVDVFAFAL